VQTLIGADGALGMVRRKMLPLHKPCSARTLQILAEVNPEYDTEFAEKKLVWDFTPVKEGLQGYVWHFPCLRDGKPWVAHGIGDVGIYSEKPRADMKRIFSRVLKSRNTPSPKTWSSHPVPWFSDKNPVSQPNVLLVGDAAGIEPAFGGGIHIALSYGEVAAQAVIDAFQNNDFSFLDYGKRLKSHLVGEWIHNCTRLALEMYGGKRNPLDVTRELFPESSVSPGVLSRMVSEVLKHLPGS